MTHFEPVEDLPLHAPELFDLKSGSFKSWQL